MLTIFPLIIIIIIIIIFVFLHLEVVIQLRIAVKETPATQMLPAWSTVLSLPLPIFKRKPTTGSSLSLIPITITNHP